MSILNVGVAIMFLCIEAQTKGEMLLLRKKLNFVNREVIEFCIFSKRLILNK